MSRFLLEREGPKVRVHMDTELTVSFVPELRELLCAVHDDGVKEVVLDLSKTTFLDTAGLSLLLAARNSFSEEGQSFKLALAQPSILSLFETLRISGRFNTTVE
ncbi:MAG TPA: STAS domain-containing protein [Polyangia bacterium]